MFGTGGEETYGIADVSSASEAAMVITNRDGISQPKTIPTCPPEHEVLSK